MLAVGGCAEIIPRFELRDDYMFKRFLQPDRVVGEIRRDEFGNPILKQSMSPIAIRHATGIPTSSVS
jgi:hypothetical protein